MEFGIRERRIVAHRDEESQGRGESSQKIAAVRSCIVMLVIICYEVGTKLGYASQRSCGVI
jgi:hypothetical protein